MFLPCSINSTDIHLLALTNVAILSCQTSGTINSFGSKTLIEGMQPKAWRDHMFDHTVIIAEDDPELNSFLLMDEAKVIQVRIVSATGAEKFAEFIFHKLNNFVKDETNERVQVRSVEFMEHGKNTAIYSEQYV